MTTVEALSAVTDHIPVRDKIDRGEILGPRLVLAVMIDGNPSAWPSCFTAGQVGTAEEARQAVLDFKKAGFDRLKVYGFLSPEAYDSIMATAKEVGMEVDGHIPLSQSVEKVLKAGQKSISHTEELAKSAKGDFSKEKAEYYAKSIADAGVWVVSTLIANRKIMESADDLEGGLQRPENRYAHPIIQMGWSPQANQYADMDPERRDRLGREFEFQLMLTKAMLDSGVKMMAGSDAMLPLIPPGFSLHWELEELVGAGFTPYQALRTSTTNPHEFLGELDRAGTIETGKTASLVLLGKNPLEDITNTRKIEGVMVRGRWLSKEELQQGLDKVAAYSGSRLQQIMQQMQK